MIRRLQRRWAGNRLALPLLLLLASRLALGIGYSQVIPIWEAYDEDGHFAYARYLAVYHHLLQPGDPEAERVWERFQPPLYYLLIAPVVGRFDLGPTLQPPTPNVYFVNGDAGVNYALHPDSLSGLESQTAQAVHAARLVGVFITTLSVLFVFQAAGRLWPRQPAAVWAVTSLYAFWPQLLFNGSVITNDLLVAAIGAAVFDLSVLLLADGFRLSRMLSLAALLAAGLLTKINAFALLPTALLAVGLSLAPAVREARRRPAQLWLGLALLAGLLVVAVELLSSMKLVTNQVFRLETFSRFAVNLAGVIQPGATNPGSPLLALAYGFRTFFASFGWGNLETYGWVYAAWAAGAALSAVGLALRGLRAQRDTARQPRLFWLVFMALQLVIAVGMALALVIAGNSIFLLPGRYLLFTLPAVCGLLVGGWGALIPRRWQVGAWKAISVGVILLGWSIPIWTLAPAYAKPRPQTQLADVPVSYRFGAAIELVGYNRPPSAHPSQTAAITLCWQATAPVSENATVFLEVVGPDGQGYGRLATYPGHGNYATSFWAVGVPFCDNYAVPVGADFPAPAVAQMRVALLATADVNGPRLPVVAANGQAVADNAVSVPLTVVPAYAPVALDHAVNVRFGDQLVLRDYALTTLPAAHAVRVDLRWEALRDLSTDYVIFVHLRDTPDHAYAQGDSPPRAGWYPTSLWRKGELVLDEHVIALPPGPVPPLALYVGVLRADTGVRLPAFDAHAAPVRDNQVILDDNVIFGAASK